MDSFRYTNSSSKVYNAFVPLMICFTIFLSFLVDRPFVVTPNIILCLNAANHRALGSLVASSSLRLPKPRELHHLRLCLKILPKLQKLLLLEMLLTLHPKQMLVSMFNSTLTVSPFTHSSTDEHHYHVMIGN